MSSPRPLASALALAALLALVAAGCGKDDGEQAGDAAAGIYRALADDDAEAFKTLDCEPAHLGLFRRTIGDLREFVLAQDVIYVGGGNTLNMLALWRLHGLDAVFREAWERGVILAGLSAGALCWFEEGVTDSLGPLAPIPALGLVSGSLCVHYDGEADRRPAFHALLAEGKLGAGYAADDGAALCFEGTALREIVTSRPAARAYRVEMGPEGVNEQVLPVRFVD